LRQRLQCRGLEGRIKGTGNIVTVVRGVAKRAAAARQIKKWEAGPVHKEEGGENKVCMRCGKLMPAGAAFCNSCGADLTAASIPGLQGAVDPVDFKAAMGVVPIAVTAAAPAALPAPLPPPGQSSPGLLVPYAASTATTAYGPYPSLYLQRRTDNLAIVSMVCAIASFLMLPLFPAVAAIATGFASRERIRNSEGCLEGNGLALAGILLGVLNLVLWVAILLAALLVFSNA
jgi:hypothetical protein